MIGYIVAALIAVFALVPPISINVFMMVNSTSWLWLMLFSGFLGLAFLSTKTNVWIKLIVVYSFVNCFLSRAPYLSFSIYSSIVASAYFYLLCTKIKDYEIIFNAHQAIFLVFVILVVMQLFKTDTLLNFHRSEKVFLGTIGNLMIFGSFIVACLTPFLISYRKLNIVPIFIVALISESAGAMLALAAGVIFYLFFKIKRKLVFLIVFAVIAAGLFLYVRNDSAVAGFWQGGRGPIWKRSLELSQEHPLEGWGIGTYKVLFPILSEDVAGGSVLGGWNYEGTTGDKIPWRRNHNCWLQIKFEGGNIGAILFLGLVGSLVWLFVRSVKTEAVILAMTGLVIIGTDMLIHFPTRMEQSIPSMLCFLAYFTYLTKREV